MISKKARRGFSLVEVTISAALAAGIIGGCMLLYSTGHKFFHKVTEHSTFRSEALLLLEHVAVDLEQLIVDKNRNPSTNKFFLVEPFEFIDPFTLAYTNPANNQTINLAAGRGIKFYRFHHIQMSGIVPQMVGQVITYQARPAGDGTFNLFRNDEKINDIPLQECVFHREPPIVVQNQLRGSPHAVLTMTVVPKGGALGSMDMNTISRLRHEGSIVGRTFHLVGYESFYTTVLQDAIRQSITTGSPPSTTTVEGAVYADAYATSPSEAAAIAASIQAGSSSMVTIPEQSFALQVGATFQDDSAAGDASWMAAPVQPGRMNGEGEWPPIGAVSSGSASSGSSSSG